MKAVSELKFGEAPVVGETYLVPCINITDRYENTWLGGVLRDHLHLMTHVPVIGTVHEDAEFPGAGGERPHIHLDTRFMQPEHLTAWKLSDESFTVGLNGIPYIPIIPPSDEKFPDTHLHPFECRRPTSNHAATYLAGEHYRVFEDTMENHSIKLDHPICPHQGTPLNGIEPINGLIHCPTHGLGFCAKTGKVARKTDCEPSGTRNLDGTPRVSLYHSQKIHPIEERQASCS